MRVAALLLLLSVCMSACGAPRVSETDSLRAVAMAEEMAMNAPGRPAADFSMLLADGSNVRLSDFLGAELLLVLFDPDCDHCMSVVSDLAESLPLGMRVLAVYADGEESLWPRAMAAVPDGWIAAFDTEGVYGEGLYSPEFIPGVYMIGADGVVISRGEENILHKK